VEKNMTFVCEPVSTADLERIDITQISRESHKNIGTPDEWVVDRDLDAYLFWGYPDREPPHPKTYVFGWKKKFWLVEALGEDGPRNEHGQRTMNLTVRYIAGTEFDKEVEENPVFADYVKDALRAFRQGLADCAPWGTQISPVVFQKFQTEQDYYHDNNRRAG
jgi:hypothetical protein